MRKTLRFVFNLSFRLHKESLVIFYSDVCNIGKRGAASLHFIALTNQRFYIYTSGREVNNIVAIFLSRVLRFSFGHFPILSNNIYSYTVYISLANKNGMWGGILFIGFIKSYNIFQIAHSQFEATNFRASFFSCNDCESILLKKILFLTIEH